MNPIAFTLFGIDVRWYGIIITTGLVLATYVATKNAKKIGINGDMITDFLLFAVPVSIICARLYYVIFEWDYYQGDIVKIINIRQGGLAIHGGLIGGFLSAYIYTKYKKIDFLKFLDLLCVSIPLGQSIGRWGNFANSEAHGVETTLPWAIEIDGKMVHPTFLYESIWDLALFFFLLYLYRNDKLKKGQYTSVYMVLYSIGRFFIEGLRTDSLMIMGLRTAQIASLLMIAIGTIGFIFFQKRNGEYSGV
ncbi:prolipoprotein diacylglyceryl transferase [Criibacterium bergeronii]|uniref:Phosphatidylglycerol--prolipoprotein diacylglyceryl transferase n=1 Tax=Criibacterium bergeronii TaxID=1871336 RepID=A0A371IM95_9FIRM|nr:prolipoprotein diacylglyceryl transferase [Criibacterium bergeronii]MBS6062269.1 prolipoprotein diacylglyceryl transferase [Peptostreptococcaceae bacterium]RDY21619.1 prolipoprotein diacylglyceryl transferase [Criibacterium bergeronii]